MSFTKNKCLLIPLSFTLLFLLFASSANSGTGNQTYKVYNNSLASSSLILSNTIKKKTGNQTYKVYNNSLPSSYSSTPLITIKTIGSMSQDSNQGADIAAGGNYRKITPNPGEPIYIQCTGSYVAPIKYTPKNNGDISCICGTELLNEVTVKCYQ
ncbi:MAG: hypothetical protein QNK11_06135 [Legionella sp.]|nr:hypothetical protein [Legionella sp.]